MPAGSLLRRGTQQLAAAGIETARLDSEVLLAYALDVSRLDLVSDDQRMVHPEAAAAFDAYLARRERHEPAAYIIGSAEFWSLSLSVTPDVLIPRPDSEILVEAALECLPANSAARVVDLGTGSGCLPLALLSERKDITVLGIDVSEAAVRIAAQNAAMLTLAGRFEALAMPMEAWLATEQSVDLIISNPPYISRPAYEGLAANVRDFEPEGALIGGEDGLIFYRMIAQLGPNCLKPGGGIAVEIGYDQREAVTALFAETFANVTCRLDLAGRDRVIVARGAIG